MFWVPLIASAGIFLIGLTVKNPWVILLGAAGFFGSIYWITGPH